MSQPCSKEEVCRIDVPRCALSRKSRNLRGAQNEALDNLLTVDF